jgi:hypothetical protein
MPVNLRIIPQGIAVVGLVIGLIGALAAVPSAQGKDKPTGKPKLNLRANPMLGFPPLRTIVTAELAGGANDYEEYYCARVEWEWGDGTSSSADSDCDPYEPGKSEIRRRYSSDHTFRYPGSYEIAFRLKQGSKIVAFSKVTVQVRDGLDAPVPSSAPRVDSLRQR